MQTVVRCDEPNAAKDARAFLVEMVESGVTHVVIAPVLGDRPLQWIVDEVVEPVRAAIGEK